MSAGPQARRGFVERFLAGVLLGVAVAGAVLIPRLLVAPQPGHQLGIGAPSTTAPPVVLAPGLPAQKSQPQTAASPQSHATHGVVPSASTSQSAVQARPATRPGTHQAAGPQPQLQPQPQPQPQPPPTIHALAPTPLVSGATTCNGTYSGTGKDVVVPSGATCVLTGGTAVTHDLTVSPGGTLIDRAVTIGHDLVAHSPAGISIDGDSVGHDLRIDGLSGSAGVHNQICNTKVRHDLVIQGSLASATPFDVGVGCPDGGNTVGHDLVVAGNANAVAVAGNSVGHDLRVDGTTATRGTAPQRHAPPPPHPHPAAKPKLPKPQHEPTAQASPKPHDEPKPHPDPKTKPHPDHPQHPDHSKPAHTPPPPHPQTDHPKPQHTPPPKPGHPAKPVGHGPDHKS